MLSVGGIAVSPTDVYLNGQALIMHACVTGDIAAFKELIKHTELPWHTILYLVEELVARDDAEMLKVIRQHYQSSYSLTNASYWLLFAAIHGDRTFAVLIDLYLTMKKVENALTMIHHLPGAPRVADVGKRPVKDHIFFILFLRKRADLIRLLGLSGTELQRLMVEAESATLTRTSKPNFEMIAYYFDVYHARDGIEGVEKLLGHYPLCSLVWHCYLHRYALVIHANNRGWGKGIRQEWFNWILKQSYARIPTQFRVKPTAIETPIKESATNPSFYATLDLPDELLQQLIFLAPTLRSTCRHFYAMLNSPADIRTYFSYHYRNWKKDILLFLYDAIVRRDVTRVFLLSKCELPNTDMINQFVTVLAYSNSVPIASILRRWLSGSHNAAISWSTCASLSPAVFKVICPDHANGSLTAGRISNDPEVLDKVRGRRSYARLCFATLEDDQRVEHMTSDMFFMLCDNSLDGTSLMDRAVSEKAVPWMYYCHKVTGQAIPDGLSYDRTWPERWYNAFINNKGRMFQ